MTHRYVVIDNVRIAYRDHNSASGAVVLLLHGNSSSSRIWEGHFDSDYFKGYRLIAPDLPGHGLSDIIPTGDYSVTSLARLMSKFVDRVVQHHRLAMVGLSLGGNVISEMLGFGVTPVAIVLLSTGLVGKEVKVHDVVKEGIVAEVLFCEYANGSSVETYFSTLLIADKPDMVRVFIDDYYRTISDFRKKFPESIVEGRYSDEIELLRKWGRQPLVIFGNQDKSMSPDVLDRVLLPYYNGKIYKVPNSGHMINLDQPAVFEWQVSQYLNCHF